MEIAPGIYLVPRVICNVYIISGTDGLTLIDTGLPGSTGKIIQQIQSVGCKPSDLRRIIITHADIDHVGSLENLRQKTGARLLSSQGEAQAIRVGKPSRELQVKGLRRLLVRAVQRIYHPKPARVDQFLTAGEELPILGGLQVIATPGHTPDHVSLWSPSTGILFSGDSIVLRSERFQPSHGMNNWDAERAQDSFQRQADLHPKFVLGGHGWAADVSEARFGGNSPYGA